MARAIGNPEWEGIAGRLLAQGYRERGDTARARRLLETSVALLAGTDMFVNLKVTRLIS